MTSWHKTGAHPFYIGMYIHKYTHIYVHKYTSQKECLHIFSLLHMRSMRNIKNVEAMHRLVTIVAGQHEIGANDVTRCYKHISFPSSHELRNTPAQKKVKFFCGHGYHLHCINRWSQPWPSRKLPSCRQIDIAHLPSRKPQPFLKEERNSSNTKPLDNSKMSHQQATLTKTQRTLVIRNFSISEESGFPHLSDNHSFDQFSTDVYHIPKLCGHDDQLNHTPKCNSYPFLGSTNHKVPTSRITKRL